MSRQRVRIIFRKDGDLRWISHRDLVRLIERMLRRAGVSLSMSEGFHPKPRMSFPLALGLGIRGEREIMELEIDEEEEVNTAALRERLAPHSPPGFDIVDIVGIPAGERREPPARQVYRVPLPADRRAEARRAIERLWSAERWPVQRDGRDEPIDVRAGLEALELDGQDLLFTITVSRQASVRPREVLAALGLDDLEFAGEVLTRVRVETAP